jgi:ABC-type iron transport system FetAB ATPase subunit
VEAVISDYRAEQAAAVLWVSHDPEQRERMNGRRLVIHDGRIEPELQATDAAETGR